MARPGIQSVALAVLLALAPAVQAGIYKWVDEKGVVNYSNTPPPESSKSVKRLEEETGRVSTIQAYDYSRAAAPARDRALQDRIARLEQELARSRQMAAIDEAMALEAHRQWRERCFAQRRVDCDDPNAWFEPGWGYGFGGGTVVGARRVPGMFRPTPVFAVGGGGVIGPFFRSPPGDLAVGPGPYGIGAGIVRVPPGGVVVGPGPGGIGSAYYPAAAPRAPARLARAPR